MKKSISLLVLVIFSQIYTAQQKKNILFIAADDLKPLLHCYGYSQMKTPNFDRLAKMGVIFTNAEVQQAVCGPSRASVMTGTYPDRTRVWDLHTNFRDSSPTLMTMPEYLLSQGYETTAVGKIFHKSTTTPGHDGKSWSIPHILPDNFDPKYGTPAYSYYQLPETKKKYEDLMKEAADKGMKPGKQKNYAFKMFKPSVESADVSDEAYQDGIYTVEAIKKMQTLAKGNKPFFLGVGFQKPHLPFVAPKKYWDMYDRDKIEVEKFQQMADGAPRFAYHDFGELRAFTDIPDDMTIGDKLPVEKQKELIHGYMAATSYVDAQLGKLLDELDRLKLTDNTIIVLWGDHGYHLGDHTEWNKHSNMEQATRIPFMFAGPGIAKNKKVSIPVELLDLFPTVFDLAGVKQSAQTDGKSLITLLDTNSSNDIHPQFALSQFPRGKDRMGYSIRTENYRYTEWMGNNYKTSQPYSKDNIIAVELYDMKNDPLETKNIAKSNPAVATEMQKMMEQKLNSIHKRVELLPPAPENIPFLGGGDDEGGGNKAKKAGNNGNGGKNGGGNKNGIGGKGKGNGGKGRGVNNKNNEAFEDF